tara:strand:+ start:485 stop:595 length:111 start_codon:yes stop_codon:yes gene_type:complete
MLITYTAGATMEELKDKLEIFTLVSIFIVSVVGIVQ